MKATINRQGKAIVERNADEFIVLLPDGKIKFAFSKEQAETICKKWFAKHTGAREIGVGTIEWR